ncbi:fructose-specific PTS transporter subunit EIIC [Pseudoflavonifractor capillosus]|uniref:Fructose-specific PTS transporter subunit EIIC n=1 Tax=Pseudoflavonifractor capillosus TaxID=106588 RepID=A0A921MK16_9FIRM|nr:fructose-specific PTS transporter subunit EIIC [Pseudoflavonifractor capillosus]HJG86008.1 fructose-specific PTS transporter subunit EIIC [Pseudoflavonifractor capillosus]
MRALRITDLLQAQGILLGAAPADKAAAVELLVSLQSVQGNLSNPAQFRQALMEREARSSTAIGSGIAVPHARSAAVLRPGLSAITAPGGVDWGAPDGSPSRLIFLIAAPEGEDGLHLELLSRLMRLLMREEFRAQLMAAATPAAFRAAIDRAEQAEFPEDFPPHGDQPMPRVLAVTACPTGIAHTYMAAEALEQAARAMGCPIQVETNGASGAARVLTPEEIAACDGIIVAADREVDMARFDGRPVLRVPVAAGISRPAALIQAVLDGKAPVYHDKDARVPTVLPAQGGEGLCRTLYKQLMNGVSHMLPFVIAGGIFIAISFLLDDPDLGYSTFGTNTQLAAWFNTVGDTAFHFMLPVLSAYIAVAIADRPGLMVGFVGGALAVSGYTFPFFSAEAVSAGFLGALVAGFAAGYLMRLIQRLLSALPSPLEGLKPVLLYPLAGLLLTGLFLCAVNPFVGMLNNALDGALGAMSEGGRIALGVAVAALMAADMGGPLNKAAYVFATSTLAAVSPAVGSVVMACAMAGGMVPPLAIALCCTFFPNRFRPAERRSGLVNYIMGLCFITEGAIPFAASDPARVIPACVAGSALAGGLAAFFNCALPAPHGGIFVFPVIRNVPGYLIALAAGSLAGMLVLALLRKKQA